MKSLHLAFTFLGMISCQLHLLSQDLGQIGDFSAGLDTTVLTIATAGQNVGVKGDRSAMLKFRHFNDLYGMSIESYEGTSQPSGLYFKSIAFNGPFLNMFVERAGDGRVGIGRSALTNNFEVEGSASKTSAGDWLANSDKRIKTNIETLKNAINKINQLRIVGFNYNDSYRREHPSLENKTYYNVIAQEYAEIFPDYVFKSSDYYDEKSSLLQVDTYPMQMYAIAAIQELSSILEVKDIEIKELRTKLDDLVLKLENINKLIGTLMASDSSKSQKGGSVSTIE